MDNILKIGSFSIQTHRYHTIVVGSGASGLSAIERLLHYKVSNIALITENVKAGTSRNAGSDKQTYYKLSLAGEQKDSIQDVAMTLFAGGAMDGDNALVEAALSAQCFFRLCELGVEFPFSQFGEHVGYKTDHDPLSRGTSAGPLTSRRMYEVLLGKINQHNFSMHDGYKLLKIITDIGNYKGLLCLDVSQDCELEFRFHLFIADNIVLATGGPASMYEKSVFPESQTGASGAIFNAGIRGKNLTEWQFGIASLKPRWNVSGSYMQVMPRFISTDSDGVSNPREFLLEYFTESTDLLNRTFKKGYQWPFDVRKLQGSSYIDLLVYRETELYDRRVFLDYMDNVKLEAVDFSSLSTEVTTYLEKTDACFGTPVQRLRKLNEPAYQFYLNKGIDLEYQRLEIAVCAQHNNGGIEVNSWWESNFPGIFACGEVAGTHGIYRPGGSALNSGQVGAQRIAYYIAKMRSDFTAGEADANVFVGSIKPFLEITNTILSFDENNARGLLKEYALLMSKVAGPLRNSFDMKQAIAIIEDRINHFAEIVRVPEKSLPWAFTLLDTLLAQKFFLKSYIEYAETKGISRGSSMYYNMEGSVPYEKLEEVFRCKLQDEKIEDMTQITEIQEGNIMFTWRKVRPIPNNSLFFEKVWESYRENGNVW